MSDFFGDLYPIPVEFNDGQQPTAAFLNAWAAQIDTAFMLLGRIIGDYDGAGEAPDTYVTNIIRTFGVMGWVTSGLPRGLLTPDATGLGGNSDIPIIKEDLSAFQDAKIALLTWRPDPTFGTEATEADILALNVAGTGEEANLGTAVGNGVSVTTSNLDADDVYILDGRRILTSDVLPADAQYIYPIDTADDTFYDAAGQGTGANLVPSMYEIYYDADPAEAFDLCTIVSLGGNQYRLDFPDVRVIGNPVKAQSVNENDVYRLDGGGVLEWYSTAPKWNVPQHLLDLADVPGADDTVPGGMAALFVKNGDAVTRVRSSTTEVILWQRVAGSSTSIQITVPGSVTLPHLADAGLTSKYIVAFAGTSLAEAVLQERNAQRRHAHDGYGDGKLISAFKLADPFDPAKWNHPELSHNHFPQYLERGGYGADAQNRHNALLGDLLLATASALPSNDDEPESLTGDSHRLHFGTTINGPRMFWDDSDTVGDGVHSLGKLAMTTRALRVHEGAYFGDEGLKSYLSAQLDGTVEVLEHLADGEAEADIRFESGLFRARSGIVEWIDEDSTETHTVGGGIADWAFDHSSDTTRISVDDVATDGIRHRAGSQDIVHIITPIDFSIVPMVDGTVKNQDITTAQSIKTSAGGSEWYEDVTNTNIYIEARIPLPVSMPNAGTFIRTLQIKDVELLMHDDSGAGVPPSATWVTFEFGVWEARWDLDMAYTVQWHRDDAAGGFAVDGNFYTAALGVGNGDAAITMDSTRAYGVFVDMDIADAASVQILGIRVTYTTDLL